MTQDWIDWAIKNKMAGCDLKKMFLQMLDAGIDFHEAYKLLFDSPYYQQKQWFFPDEKSANIIFQSSSPEIVLFSNFLTNEECDLLILNSENRLSEATVVDTVNGGTIVHPARTSNNAYFQVAENPLIASIEERIAALINIPIRNGEGLQVLNYPVGREYKSHFDFFSSNATSHLQMGGQRIATFIMYLNDVEEGGETTFPDLKLKIAPKKGNALFFSYLNDEEQTDLRTLHAGNPVLVGNKWIATKWLRQRSIS